MDANTDPRDVLQVTCWTTKQEISKKLREHQSWNPYDIISSGDDGLMSTLIFLTRDMGLEAHLEPFRVFVSERALLLFNRAIRLGRPYQGVSKSAYTAYEEANGLNGRNQSVVGATLALRRAMMVSVEIAVEQAVGELYEGFRCAYTPSEGALRQENFILAQQLVGVLESKGLL